MLADQLIDKSQIEELQRNLISSHSVGVGPYFDEKILTLSDVYLKFIEQSEIL